MRLVYNRTVEGFLSAVFHVFDQKLIEVNIVSDDCLLDPNDADIHIETDVELANRVKKALQDKVGERRAACFFYVFQSGQEDLERTLLDYCRNVFLLKNTSVLNTIHPSALKLARLERSINSEKHKTETSIRFKLCGKATYFACVEPKFDLIPFLVKSFEKEYAGQNWIIYDLKRQYGIHNNKKETKYIRLIPVNEVCLDVEAVFFNHNELEFPMLWTQALEHSKLNGDKVMLLKTEAFNRIPN